MIRRRVSALGALAFAWGLGAAGCGEDGPATNLVLISLDTVRRDHLGAYGYGRSTSPTIDRFASQGVAFDAAVAQQTNTNPSHASILTGLYPHEHGSLRNGVPIAAERRTLAEILSGAGFRTGAFVSALPLKRPYTGLEQGFEIYDDAFAVSEQRRSGAETVDRAIEWLRGVGAEERYFLFLHLYDAHGPYVFPEGVEPAFSSPDPGPQLDRVPDYQRLTGPGGAPVRRLHPYVDRYDSLILYQDRQIERLLRRVNRSETLVVVVADHGEVLGGRYWPLDHGGTAFDDEVRVPLVMAGPGLLPARVDATVETVDLLPTLVEFLGLPDPPVEVSGRSLGPLLEGDGEWDSPRAAHASARADANRHADRGYDLDPDRFIHALRTRRWKLIRYPVADGEDRIELYDLRHDPGETTNVASERPAVRDRLLRGLDAWHRPPVEAGELPPPDEIPPNIRRHLEALGYLDVGRPEP